MSNLKPVHIDPDTVIWIEANNAATPVPDTVPARAPVGVGNGHPELNGSEPEQGRVSKGWLPSRTDALGRMTDLMPPTTEQSTESDSALQQNPALDKTIKSYTKYALGAFRNDHDMNAVKKVTLEFGVNLSGVGGLPYIASGTVGCNIKITVECDFSKEDS